MYYATCYYTYENEHSLTGTTYDSGYVTSAVFPQYLSAEGTLRFPTPEELVTEGGAYYDSALEYQTSALDAITSTNVPGDREISFRIKNQKGETITDSNTVRIGTGGTYTAIYKYRFNNYLGDSDKKITYTYTFSAVANRLPLKPWTVKDVVDRILDCAIPLYSNGTDSTEYSRRYTLDPDQAAWLDTVDGTALRRAPEFTMTRCTLREQLQVVGGFIHAEPRLITKMHKDEDGNPVIDGQYIHFDRYGETKQSEAANAPYVYRRKFRDINQFCTAVDSITDNMVNSIKWARGSIVAPWYGQGLCVHTETQYLRVNDTNGIVPTDFPIQRIKRVLCGAWDRKKGGWWKDDSDPGGMVDITSFVVESTAYNANLSSYDGTYPYSKSYAIYYTMG